MKIILCDDNPEVINTMQIHLNKYKVEKGEDDIMVIPFSCGEDFLDYYAKVKNIDIVFLDILMKDINGIQVAERIREEDKNMHIFFLTSIKSYVFEGYKVRATNYLIKPVNYNKLRRELDNAINILKERNNNYILEKNDRGVFKIYLEDIIYVETYQRNTMIHTTSGDILSYKNMKRHVLSLGDNFFRVHESYIANLKYIKSIVKMDVELLSGVSLIVSKSRRKELMEKLTIYYGKQI